MRTKAKFEQLNQELQADFEAVAKDIGHVHQHVNALADAHSEMSDDFYELRDELATNGVIRDIRKLQKDVKAMENGLSGLRGLVEDKLAELNTNGVMRTIKEVREQVFHKKKKREDGLEGLRSLMGVSIGGSEDATLAGKVEAIIEHLGLDVSVQPGTTSKVVASRAKTTKKKGSRR